MDTLEERFKDALSALRDIAEMRKAYPDRANDGDHLATLAIDIARATLEKIVVKQDLWPE